MLSKKARWISYLLAEDGRNHIDHIHMQYQNSVSPPGISPIVTDSVIVKQLLFPELVFLIIISAFVI